MKELIRENLLKIVSDYPDLKFDFEYRIWQTDFLRFFRSQINYNISNQISRLNAVVHKGKRSYTFGITDPDLRKIRQHVADAMDIIDKLPPDPDFNDIEDDTEIIDLTDKPSSIETLPLEKKIDILEAVSKAVEPYGFRIYGTFICNHIEDIIINSNGLDKRSVLSPIMLELKAVSDENHVTVLQSFGGENFGLFNQEKFINDMVMKVKAAGSEIVDVEPGEYEVVLAPRVIGELIFYLSYGMSASSLDMKRSFFEGKLDQKIFPESITLRDNPDYPGLIQYAYNHDGHIYKPVTLIENGVFKNFFVDNYYGRKLNMEKNGAGGLCIVLEPGEETLEELIKPIKRGLYISSLHYMNFINPKETSVTGLTRDGTFLIEDGEITRVVNNLRYTQRIAEIVERITGIENANTVVPFSDNYEDFDIETASMPHVRVNGFKISSSTETI